MLFDILIQTRYLAQAGGKTVGETCRNVMARMMTSEVAVKCNWRGKGEKYAFGNTRLKKVVCGKCNLGIST